MRAQGKRNAEYEGHSVKIYISGTWMSTSKDKGL